MEKVKEMIALFVLAISAYTDIKERQIYLMPLFIAGISSLAISLILFMTNPLDDSVKGLFSSVIFPFLFGAFVIYIAILLRKSVGIGDAYLIAVLSLSVGVSCNVRILCTSSLLAGVVCFCLMMTDRAKKWKTIPFAPFILAGFICVLFVKNL